MRRRIALTPVLGLLLAGFGCNHIGGKNDCQYRPCDGEMPAISPPYAAFPATEPKGIPLPTDRKDAAPGPKKIDEVKKPVDDKKAEEKKPDDKKVDDKKPIDLPPILRPGND